MSILFALFTIALSIVHKVQAQLLPPGFVLFDKTAGDYGAQWFQYNFPLSTNQSYQFPPSGSLGDPVFFLEGVQSYLPVQGVRTFTIPENVYIFFPIISIEGDNIGVIPPLSVDELRNVAAAIMDLVIELHASIDGIDLTNLFAYRAPSPIFTIDLPNPDNIISFWTGSPWTGIIDPAVCEGYWLMFKPLPLGLHKLRSGCAFAPPLSYTFDISFQINIVTVGEFLAPEIEKLAGQIENSSLPSNRQQPLLASLRAAHDSFQSNSVATGLNQLDAFQHKVRAQVRPGDEPLADDLIQAAQRIIDRATGQLE